MATGGPLGLPGFATSRSDLAGRLAQHVQRLAVDIGERNVWHPAGMQAAARYIRDEWRATATPR